MGANTITRGSIFLTATMKRHCSLCLGMYKYQDVTKYKHGLNICDTCYDCLEEIMCKHHMLKP